MTVGYCATLVGGQGRMNQKYLTSDRFQVTALPMKRPTKLNLVILLVFLVAFGFLGGPWVNMWLIYNSRSGTG